MKQPAIIIDLDGTLVDSSHREPYDYDKIIDDKVIVPVDNLIDFSKGIYHFIVILLSGRSEDCREQTEDWLWNNASKYDYLILNKNKENQIIFKKKEIKKLMKKYDILYCLDDNPEVVKMYKSLGLKAYSII